MKELIRRLHAAADALEALYQEREKTVDSTALVNAVRHSIKKGKRVVHWTQTAEGRKKMSRISKKAWRNKQDKQS